MNRSKIVALVTGAISLILAIAYLIIVQLLDFRGEMLPAPVSQLPADIQLIAGISAISVDSFAPQPQTPASLSIANAL